MSNVINLFNFGRALPAPFEKAGKKVGVSSKYGDKTQATLCATVIKGVHAYLNCMDGVGEGAVGASSDMMIAEYASSVSGDFHLVVYDPYTGSVKASVYNVNTEMSQNYILHSTGRDGAAVIMAMIPALCGEEEFKQNLELYHDERAKGYPEFEKATEYMAILCDNAYRRIKDDSCAAHLKFEVDISGNLMRVAKTQIDKGEYEPNKVFAGEFQIFSTRRRTAAPIKSAKPIVEIADFVGKYPLSERKLSAAEQALVPVLPEWYVIPQEVIDICKHASATTGKPSQMRNFLLRGPAGTGKTMGAKAIAAGLGVPYVKYTCSAGTEIYDFIGQVFPETEDATTGDAELDMQRKKLKEMGGMTYENVAKLMGLPDLDDMDYDPEGTYFALTGIKKEDVAAQDCMKAVLDRVTEQVRLLSDVRHTEGGGQKYTYTETDFLKALKFGYVVEIQEPTTIVQPGVLVGLNSLLEQDGAITLPTGEVIRRHPDAVVIVTTNVSYEGCRGMNQSIIDRMSLVREVELPTKQVMLQRAMSVTGETDEFLVSQMVEVVNSMSEYCQSHGIEDGNVGMRGLIDWILSTQVTGDPYSSALYTIVSKASADEGDRQELIANVLEPVFAAKRKTA